MVITKALRMQFLICCGHDHKKKFPIGFLCATWLAVNLLGTFYSWWGNIYDYRRMLRCWPLPCFCYAGLKSTIRVKGEWKVRIQETHWRSFQRGLVGLWNQKLFTLWPKIDVLHRRKQALDSAVFFWEDTCIFPVRSCESLT